MRAKSSNSNQPTPYATAFADSPNRRKQNRKHKHALQPQDARDALDQQFALLSPFRARPTSSLPSNLWSTIDPISHKAYGTPLLLPPLTVDALNAFRQRVIKQLVDMNQATGRGDGPFHASHQHKRDVLQNDEHKDADHAPHLPMSALPPSAIPDGTRSISSPHRTLSTHAAPSTASTAISSSTLTILEATSVPVGQHDNDTQSKQAAVIVEEEKEKLQAEKEKEKEKDGEQEEKHVHAPLSIALPSATQAAPSPSPSSAASTSTSMPSSSVPASRSTLDLGSSLSAPLPSNELVGVEFTPLSYIPGARVRSYLGRVCVHLIRESYSYRSQSGGGDLGSFVTKFMLETNQLARAHVLSRGGNALLAYTIQEIRVIEENKNQVYAVLSVSGDSAHVVKDGAENEA